VVLLSKPLAHILDYGIELLGAPTALGAAHLVPFTAFVVLIFNP
jgi:hypothetical protein